MQSKEGNVEFWDRLSSKLARGLRQLNNETLVKEKTPRPDPPEEWEREQTTDGRTPSVRISSSAAVFVEHERPHLMLFGGLGGCGGRGPSGRTNKVYTLPICNPNKDSLNDEPQFDVRWRHRKCAGHPPMARSGHTGVMMDHEFWVYGGEGSFGGPNDRETFGDMQVLNTITWTWRAIQPSAGRPYRLFPAPRRGHSCCELPPRSFVDDEVSSEDTDAGDLLVLSSQQRDRSPSSTSSPVSSFSSSSSRRRLLVFGGAGPDRVFMKDQYLDDLFTLDIYGEGAEEYSVWTKVDPTGPSPGPRAGHTANYVKGKGVFVIGGAAARMFVTKEGARLINDDEDTIAATSAVLVLRTCSETGGAPLGPPGENAMGFEWTTPNVLGTPPRPRTDHTTVHNPAEPRYLYVYGGTSSRRTPLREDDGIHILDTGSVPMCWLPNCETRGDIPRHRSLHVAASFSVSGLNRMVIFGGSCSGRYSSGDVFTLDMHAFKKTAAAISHHASIEARGNHAFPIQVLSRNKYLTRLLNDEKARANGASGQPSAVNDLEEQMSTLASGKGKNEVDDAQGDPTISASSDVATPSPPRGWVMLRQQSPWKSLVTTTENTGNAHVGDMDGRGKARRLTPLARSPVHDPDSPPSVCLSPNLDRTSPVTMQQTPKSILVTPTSYTFPSATSSYMGSPSSSSVRWRMSPKLSRRSGRKTKRGRERESRGFERDAKGSAKDLTTRGQDKDARMDHVRSPTYRLRKIPHAISYKRPGTAPTLRQKQRTLNRSSSLPVGVILRPQTAWSRRLKKPSDRRRQPRLLTAGRVRGGGRGGGGDREGGAVTGTAGERSSRRAVADRGGGIMGAGGALRGLGGGSSSKGGLQRTVSARGRLVTTPTGSAFRAVEGGNRQVYRGFYASSRSSSSKDGRPKTAAHRSISSSGRPVIWSGGNGVRPHTAATRRIVF